MLFVRSMAGVSHTKDEDTPVEDLELSVRALHELTLRTLDWAVGRREGVHGLRPDASRPTRPPAG